MGIAMHDLQFKTSGGHPGGFVAEVDGYLCFVVPEVDPALVAAQNEERPQSVQRPQAQSDQIVFRWKVQEGGGWTHRGGEKVVTLAEGIAFSAETAEQHIYEWLDEHVDIMNS